jgi:hypothetical protein
MYGYYPAGYAPFPASHTVHAAQPHAVAKREGASHVIATQRHVPRTGMGSFGKPLQGGAKRPHAAREENEEEEEEEEDEDEAAAAAVGEDGDDDVQIVSRMQSDPRESEAHLEAGSAQTHHRRKMKKPRFTMGPKDAGAKDARGTADAPLAAEDKRKGRKTLMRQPRKPQTGYHIFCHHNRVRVAEEHPEMGKCLENVCVCVCVCV